tara:strand:+ start:672 stop:1019 length:348 start_codon:yes stop_codon:yes gene_type:complete
MVCSGHKKTLTGMNWVRAEAFFPLFSDFLRGRKPVDKSHDWQTIRPVFCDVKHLPIRNSAPVIPEYTLRLISHPHAMVKAVHKHLWKFRSNLRAINAILFIGICSWFHLKAYVRA